MKVESKICKFCEEENAIFVSKCWKCGKGFDDQIEQKEKLFIPKEIEAKSSVWDGVKIGFGIFVVLPLLFISGCVALVFLSSSLQETSNWIAKKTNSVGDQEQVKKDYVGFIKIENTRIGKGYAQFDIPEVDKPKVGIYGTIRNLGNKTLKEVELTIFLKNQSGQIIAEEKFNPVWVSSFNFLNDKSAAPLKPNYVREFGHSLEGAPKEWSGAFSIGITKIEFQEESEQFYDLLEEKELANDE